MKKLDISVAVFLISLLLSGCESENSLQDVSQDVKVNEKSTESVLGDKKDKKNIIGNGIQTNPKHTGKVKKLEESNPSPPGDLTHFRKKIQLTGIIEKAYVYYNPFMQENGLHLIVSNQSARYIIHVCPQWYADQEKIIFGTKEEITIDGFQKVINGQLNIFAITLRYNKNILQLRDPNTGKGLWAGRYAPPNNETNEAHTYTPEPIDVELIEIPGGCFQMGSSAAEHISYEDEGPVHEVYVSDFLMGKYEVSQEEWQKIMGNNPAFFHGDNYPVEQVSWNDIQQFILILNMVSGKQYRLPTEAEWEYAARAGTSTARYWGKEISCDKAMYENKPHEIKQLSWDRCAEYILDQGYTVHSTAPIGSYPENQFGLHDMLGNVFEWCSDRYSEKYEDSISPQNNPTGPASGRFRVTRGGGWHSTAASIRAANRNLLAPEDRNNWTGFRLVLPVHKLTSNNGESDVLHSASPCNRKEDW